MQLLSLYKAILAALNIDVSPEGLLTLHLGDMEIEATIEGKRLTLPTPEVLRAGHWEHLMAFHPLSEHPGRGESQMIDMLRRAVGFRISVVMTALLYQFAYLGNDVSRHKSVPPSAADVLSTTSGIDDKFVAAIEKIIANQEPSGANRFVSIYLKRGGTYLGRQRARVAVASFPLLDQLQDSDDTVFGVKLRKKDKSILESMFTYILPGSDQPETYNAPSTSLTAPYFDALMRAFAKIADRLNEVVRQHWDLLSQTVEDPESLITDTSWLSYFTDLSAFDGQVPPLDGNQGKTRSGDEDEAPERVPASAAVSAAQNVFKVHQSAAAPAAPAARAPVTDSPPWREDPPAAPVKEGNKGPFHTEHLGEALRRPSGPFQTAAPSNQYKSANDPNAFDRSSTPGKKDDYAEWVAKNRNQAYGKQVQPGYYGAPTGAPTGYGRGPTAPVTYGHPAPVMPAPNTPVWAQSAPPVAPGEYAGRDRGVPMGQMGYGYGNVNQPAWMAPVAPPVGYGYPQPGPMYGNGGYGQPGYQL